MLQRCLDCLREAASGQLDNLYTSALLSYTFTLAGDQQMRSKLITYLHQKSSSKGEMGRKGRPLLVTCFISPTAARLCANRLAWRALWGSPQAALVTGTELELQGKVWTLWRWR